MNRRALLALFLPLPFAALPLIAFAFTANGSAGTADIVLEAGGAQSAPQQVLIQTEPNGPQARLDAQAQPHSNCDFDSPYEGT